MSDKKIEFPYKFRNMEPHEQAELDMIHPGDLVEYSRVGPKGYFVTKRYETMASDIYNMEVRPSDIFVASFARSGTTLTQELVWLISNNMDIETAKAEPLGKRYPFLEMAMFFNEAQINKYIEISKDKEDTEKLMDMLATPATDILPQMPDPRFAKTHLPMSLLPPYILDKAKVVYVARDPRDVIVSCYHQTKLFREAFGFKCSFKQFWNVFRKDLFTLTPYFEHIKEAWALRHNPNMLFLFYNDLTKDLPASIHRVADFLGKTITREQTAILCDHLHIDNFKKNKSVNFEELRPMGLLSSDEAFIRKGQTGGWRNYFDEEMLQEAQQWIDENLKGTDLNFGTV